jgi:hypothetical protein
MKTVSTVQLLPAGKDLARSSRQMMLKTPLIKCKLSARLLRSWVPTTLLLEHLHPFTPVLKRRSYSTSRIGTTDLCKWFLDCFSRLLVLINQTRSSHYNILHL